MRYVPILIALAMGTTACHQRMWVRTDGSMISDQVAFQRDGIDCEAMMRAGALSFGGGFVGAANAQDFLVRCMQSRGYMLIDAPKAAQNVTSGPGPSAARDAAQRCRRDCERANRDAQCFENCKNFE